VVVAEEVARMVEGFSFQDIGRVTLRGVAAPMRLFRAER
jgi:class 3 adenylate cyclase